MGNRILILGGSGFIGNSLYKELHSYFEVHGTFCQQKGAFAENQTFYNFCVEKDSLFLLLNKVKPNIIISAISGDAKSQMDAHQELVNYALINPKISIIYCSSNEVFNGKFTHPSYENDIQISETASGKLKIAIEKLLLSTIPLQTTIVRLPFVLGINSPRMVHLRQCIRHEATFEVFPNLVISATTINKFCQQTHYIINHELRGIYHLASMDMVHHEDLFKEIALKIGAKMPNFKSVYSSNEERYNAILPKNKLLPPTHQITIQQVVDACCLNEEIMSIK